MHHCIHTVGPKLGHGKYTDTEAVWKLAGAYRNVLSQFVRFAVSKAAADPAPTGTPMRLRLLPISGGLFAGEYQQHIAPLTLAALEEGIGLLTEEERGVLARQINSLVDENARLFRERSHAGGIERRDLEVEVPSEKVASVKIKWKMKWFP